MSLHTRDRAVFPHRAVFITRRCWSQATDLVEAGERTTGLPTQGGEPASRNSATDEFVREHYGFLSAFDGP